MRKIAAIDIGTNSVLYSLFKVIGQSQIKEIFFRRNSPRIGSRMKGESKPLITDDSYSNLRKILTRDMRHAEKNGAGDILLAATNPFRLASNGEEIKDRLNSDLGCVVNILSTDREAFLSFLGAVGRLGRNRTAVLIDLGGGSTELVVYRGDRRLAFVSIPEGAVSLTEKFDSGRKVNSERLAEFEKYLSRYNEKAEIIRRYLRFGIKLVGGTTTALAYLKNSSILTDQGKVSLTDKDMELFVNLLARLGLSSRRELLAIDKKRAEIIFAGAFWLRHLFNVLDIKKAEATPKGLRHGMVKDFISR